MAVATLQRFILMKKIVKLFESWWVSGGRVRIREWLNLICIYEERKDHTFYLIWENRNEICRGINITYFVLKNHGIQEFLQIKCDHWSPLERKYNFMGGKTSLQCCIHLIICRLFKCTAAQETSWLFSDPFWRCCEICHLFYLQQCHVFLWTWPILNILLHMSVLH